MPNRILKESICTSDSLDSLSWFEEVLFYRLIVNCDDFGRFDGRPAVIKNRLFPLKENLTLKAVSAAINTLANAGIVTLYEFEGKSYLYLPTWHEHQSVRAKRSKYPDPPQFAGVPQASASICKQMISDESICPRNPIQYECDIRESNTNADANTRVRAGESSTTNKDDDFASVMNYYTNRINAMPSSGCAGELAAYTEKLSGAVVIHALEKALDERKTAWSYIRGILSSYLRGGLKTLDDVLLAEQEFQTQKELKKSGTHTNAGKPDDAQKSDGKRWGLQYDLDGAESESAQ